MSDDNDGFVNDPGWRSPQNHEESSIPKEDPESHSVRKANRSLSDDGSPINKDFEDASDLTSDQVDEIVSILSSSSWSGILPPPASFAQYPEYAQKQMVAWNDAEILDESKRRDRQLAIDERYAKSDARFQMTKLVLSFVIELVFVLSSVVLFLITLNPNSFWLLTVPGATIAVNLYLGTRKDD